MARTERTSTSHRLTRVAAVSAAALVGAGVVGAGPADAESASLTYSCTTILGPSTFTSVLDTDAPATVPVGKAVDTTTSADVTVPASIAGLLSGALHVTSFSGTATATGYTNGVPQTIDMTVPTTSVPASGDMVVPSTGPSGSITGQHAGDVITFAAGDFSSTLTFFDADGNPVLTDQTIPCTLDPGQDATVDTVQVVKATSWSWTSAHYGARTKQVTARTKVKGAYANDPSGRVTCVVTKGTRQVATTSRKLDADNVARATFGKAVRRPGTYTVTTTYSGNGDLKGSTDTATVSVPR